jgi:hypothetical protein
MFRDPRTMFRDPRTYNPLSLSGVSAGLFYTGGFMPFVPKKDVLFKDWASTLILYAQQHLAAFNIQDAVFQPLLASQAAFEAAYTKALDPNRGPVDVAEKNRTRSAFEKALRDFIKAFLEYSPFVSDADRDQMQIPIHDTTHTPVPPPETFPEYDCDTSIPNRISLHVWDAASKRKAKPEGVHGAEIRWEMREEAPLKAEDLSNSDFSTRTPHTFEFTGDKQGKRVYFCLRWENPKGEKGPWGAITSAIIP